MRATVGMSTPAEVAAASYGGPVAGVFQTDKRGVYAQAASASSVSVELPSELWGRFLDVQATDQRIRWHFSLGTAGQAVSLTAQGTFAAGNAQCGWTAAAMTTMSRRAPRPTKNGDKVWLNYINDGTTGLVEICLTEAPGG